MSDERRRLLDRYVFADFALKVVGIGSVGTRTMMILMIGKGDGDPLFLQLKEAQASVLEAYAGASRYPHHGQRVVCGQRLSQAASDIFLGWVSGPLDSRIHYYVRQLRDMKGLVRSRRNGARRLRPLRAGLRCLAARAHARSGDAR